MWEHVIILYMRIRERLVDIGYEIAAKYQSVATGRTTRVEKVITEGTKINGEIKDGVFLTREQVLWKAFETEQVQTVDNFRAREVRRSIVFG